MEQLPEGTIYALSRTLGRMEKHLESIDATMNTLVVSDKDTDSRLTSLEISRATARGGFGLLTLILGYLGYDTGQFSGW